MNNNPNGFYAGQTPNGQPAPLVSPLQNLGKDAAPIDCPYCNESAVTVVTMIKQDPENCGIIYCLTCLVCCPLLICLPMILKGKDEWHHACANCKNKVAIRYEDGRVEVLQPAHGQLVPSQYTSHPQLKAPTAVHPATNQPGAPATQPAAAPPTNQPEAPAGDQPAPPYTPQPPQPPK